MKSDKLEELPKWAIPLLQGVAFWLGYKKQLFRYYHLSEGAIIGESVNLMYSHLLENEQLHCEKMYRDLGLNSKDRKRADLIIAKSDGTIEVVIEVKRSDAPKQFIDEDISKLSLLKTAKKRIRCFLLVVSQGSRPKWRFHTK